MVRSVPADGLVPYGCYDTCKRSDNQVRVPYFAGPALKVRWNVDTRLQ